MRPHHLLDLTIAIVTGIALYAILTNQGILYKLIALIERLF